MFLAIPTPVLAANVDESTRLIADAQSATGTQISPNAEEVAKLLGLDAQIHRYLELKRNGKLDVFDREALQLQTSLIRKVMTIGLELRTVSAHFDKEITIERQAVDRLSNERDFIVAQTNNLNFYQLGILSMIIDGPLAQTENKHRILASNQLNIVSGLMVGGLAALAFLERRGGIRHTRAEPNLLGQTLGLNAPSYEQLPPFLWTYLNSVAPDSTSGLTRRQQLLEYWKHGRNLSINIKKPKNIEKVSVLGPHHHQWCESIKLINNRLSMMFDLRAMIDLLNTGLAELLEALD
ncbi:MAG: hypothetical protein K2Y22_17825 [Candidatus Obscuribacterales bacterium]|nr:hypothetical protein [Candidatus Obscuribacterales bacterium]